MGDREQSEKLKELKESGVYIWSFSKFGAFEQCPYQYKLSYIDEIKGIDGVYGKIGGIIHDALENIYNDKNLGKEELENAIMNGKIEMEIEGYSFPNEQIENSYMANINHYIRNFSRHYDKCVTEKEILYNFKDILSLKDDMWVLGYVDMIVPDPDSESKEIIVVDWKTSSKFAGKKLKEAGRQLILYAYILEQTTKYKVSKVAWEMLKYCNVCYKQKNGKISKSMQERKDWVKYLTKKLEKDLEELDKVEFEIEALIDQAIENNNLDNMPKEIQEKYWIEDCIVYYDYNEENINEVLEWLKYTKAMIEFGVENDELKPVEINKQTEFFCGVLCGHRLRCEYYKKYKESKEFIEGIEV